MAEADENSSREGRKVNDRRRLEIALYVGDRIGENEPSFGVRVDHFDRLTRHRRNDVARALGIAAWHVLDQPADADDIGLCLAQREGLERTRHGARAAHVPFHGFHASGGFYGDATGIEGHALADEGRRRAVVWRSVPLEDQKAGLTRGALCDSKEGAHA